MPKAIVWDDPWAVQPDPEPADEHPATTAPDRHPSIPLRRPCWWRRCRRRRLTETRARRSRTTPVRSTRRAVASAGAVVAGAAARPAGVRGDLVRLGRARRADRVRVVHPLPGIGDGFTINTAITLPIGVETYAAYALRVWLSGPRARAGAPVREVVRDRLADLRRGRAGRLPPAGRRRRHRRAVADHHRRRLPARRRARHGRRAGPPAHSTDEESH